MSSTSQMSTSSVTPCGPSSGRSVIGPEAGVSTTSWSPAFLSSSIRCMPNEGDLTETARAEAERLISRYFAWKARAGRSLSDSSRARYRPVLLSLADERGSLLNVTVNDLLDFQDSRRHLSDSTRGHDRVVLRGFFRFARQEGLRSDNPAEALVAPATRRKRMPMRRWVSAPRRDALPKAYRPIFDFLREVWGRHPELSFQDVLTIRSPGGVPEVVEVRSGRKRGQLVTLSPGARRALTEMGGSIPVTKGAIERVFRDSYQRAFSPTDLKRIPPVGFGVDLHESLEGEVRELLMLAWPAARNGARDGEFGKA